MIRTLAIIFLFLPSLAFATQTEVEAQSANFTYTIYQLFSGGIGVSMMVVSVIVGAYMAWEKGIVYLFYGLIFAAIVAFTPDIALSLTGYQIADSNTYYICDDGNHECFGNH